MKHTLLLLVHKNLDQITCLLNFLLGENINAVVHVDAKQHVLKKNLTDFYLKNKNIIILDDNIKVNWSGLSGVKAEIKLMREALQLFPESDYYHLISAECTPLYSVDKWADFLDGKSFIDSKKTPEYEWRIRRYMPFGESAYNRKLFFRVLSRLIREAQRFFPLRSNFGDEAQLKGANWFSLTKQDMALVIERCDETFVRKLKHTRCADEHFLQILAHQLALEFHPYDLRYTCWEKGRSSPNYLTYEQLVTVKDQQTHLFARKVTPEVLAKFLQEGIA